MDYLPSKGTYRENNQILANRLGIVQLDGKVIKTIPLSGRYLPKKDDVVIGKVTDVLLTGWRIEINSPYESVLTLKDASSDFIQRGADLTRYFEIGDWVVCQIVQVTSQNLIDVSMRGPGLRKLVGGQVKTVNAQKVPRIIGARASMLGMIKSATGENIIVGQNGRVWMSGTPANEVVALAAIALIERESHISGLTERVQSFLKEKTGKSVQPVDDSQVGNSDNLSEQHTSVIRSQIQRDPSQLGGFRSQGFRKGGFQNTNAPNSQSSENATQQNKQEDSQ